MNDVRKPDARETALEVLMQVDSANAWSDGGLKRTIAKNKLDSRDAALATRLCYGVIQNRMLLDYYIGCWCSQRPERLESVIRNILRLGGYQILFLDKVPPRAAVNEAVEMTKRHRREKAAGMVNAILRKFAANREDMPPLPKGSPAQTLSLRYSHPRWLVERLLSLIGEEETEAYLRMNNQVVPTTIQTNPLKGTPEELEKLLRQTGAQVEPHPWLAGCFSVSGAAVRLPGGPLHRAGRSRPSGGHRGRPGPRGSGAGRVRRSRRQVLCHGHGPPGSGPDPLLRCPPPQAEAHRQRRPASGHHQHPHGAGRCTGGARRMAGAGGCGSGGRPLFGPRHHSQKAGYPV